MASRIRISKASSAVYYSTYFEVYSGLHMNCFFLLEITSFQTNSIFMWWVGFICKPVIVKVSKYYTILVTFLFFVYFSSKHLERSWMTYQTQGYMNQTESKYCERYTVCYTIAVEILNWNFVFFLSRVCCNR